MHVCIHAIVNILALGLYSFLQKSIIFTVSEMSELIEKNFPT